MNRFELKSPLLAAFAAIAGLALSPASALAEAYTIKLDNLTRGQHFTPPIFIVHNDQYSLFTLGDAASAAVISMAEGGETMLIQTAVGTNGATAAASGPINPGASATVCVDTGTNAAFTRLSLAGMLLPTNDGFVAANGIEAAMGSYYLNAYDAGSEGNTEAVADIPAPPFLTTLQADGKGIGSEATGEGYVHIHRGVIGDNIEMTASDANLSDIQASLHRWLNPVARATITVADGACPAAN